MDNMGTNKKMKLKGRKLLTKDVKKKPKFKKYIEIQHWICRFQKNLNIP